jgi:hypothetical protein
VLNSYGVRLSLEIAVIDRSKYDTNQFQKLLLRFEVSSLCATRVVIATVDAMVLLCVIRLTTATVSFGLGHIGKLRSLSVIVNHTMVRLSDRIWFLPETTVVVVGAWQLGSVRGIDALASLLQLRVAVSKHKQGGHGRWTAFHRPPRRVHW